MRDMKDVAEVPFSDVVSSFRTQFVIPVWQRLYAWEIKEWSDLWDDIWSVYQKQEKGETVEHFLGPVVLKTVEEKIGEITRRIMIDGQQRLTTLLLILAVIRNRAKQEGKDNLVKQIEEHFLFNADSTKNDDKPKLRLTRADRDAFELIIKGEDPSPSDASQVVPAYAFFTDQLEEFKGRYELSKLFDTIRKLKLVTMRLDEKDNPNRIFETLNYRGKELAQSDLVRNLFMMSVRDDARAEQTYNRAWFPMEQGFGATTEERTGNLELFLRHYLTMIKSATVKENSIYAEIRERVKNAEENQTLKELQVISNYAKYYQRLLFPHTVHEPEIAEGLRRLNVFGVTVHYPFTMKVYHAYESQTVTLTDFISILQTIESYIIRRYFEKLPTNALNKLFASLCSLPDDDLSSALANELRAKESWSTQYWPTDEEFKKSFQLLPIYQDSDSRCRFVLTILEQSFKHPEPIQYDHLTIEHVLPETITQHWKKYLGNNWEVVFNSYVHTIGNLTLIAGPPNSSLQQDLFKDKKDKWYKKSNVELTKELASRWNEWREKDIDRRASELGDRAIKIWKRA
jgi:uncharacterized protein with ParB-like and HNH nuclease domain